MKESQFEWSGARAGSLTLCRGLVVLRTAAASFRHNAVSKSHHVVLSNALSGCASLSCWHTCIPIHDVVCCAVTAVDATGGGGVSRRVATAPNTAATHSRPPRVTLPAACKACMFGATPHSSPPSPPLGASQDTRCKQTTPSGHGLITHLHNCAQVAAGVADQCPGTHVGANQLPNSPR